VERIVAISETGIRSGPEVMANFDAAERASARTKIDPGEQRVSLTLNVTFELE